MLIKSAVRGTSILSNEFRMWASTIYRYRHPKH